MRWWTLYGFTDYLNNPLKKNYTSMGGNALNFQTERKTTEQFNEIFSKIEPILIELGITYFLTKCYRNKPTHGDMDILIKNNNLNKTELIKIIIDKFKPTSLSPNDKTISFDYDQFQIDFILIDEDSWDIAKTWYSNDPFSNACGKLVHKFSLKYGPNGLIYPFRGENETMVKDIVISKDARKIFTFFDYDFDKFEQGFDEIEEIFDFIITSKYFNHNVFRYENLNRIDRKRNKRRKSYNELLKYIDNNNITKEYIFDEKSSYINYINDYFPESRLIETINDLIEKDNTNKLINSKFNGKSVMERYPDLKGKELGYMMMTFKENFSDFNDFILKNSIDEIYDKFNLHYLNKKELN